MYTRRRNTPTVRTFPCQTPTPPPRPADTLFPIGQPLAKFPIALSYLLEDRSLEDVADATRLRPIVIQQHLAGVLAPTAAERQCYAEFMGWTLGEFDRQVRLWGTGARVRLDIDRKVAERLDELAMRENLTIEGWLEQVVGKG